MQANRDPREHRAHDGDAGGTVQCTASDLLRWLGRVDDASDATARIVFQMRRVRAGQVLVHEGGPFGSLYFVRTGAFKCFRSGPDGNEQVDTFAWPGDAIGFEAICDDRYGATATAIEDAMVVAAPYGETLVAAQGEPALQRLLHHVASREVQRRCVALHTNAAVAAEARVARFLLQLAARQVAAGISGDHLRLSMSRRDIASHLGLAHESVSRSLSALEHGGCVRVARRAIDIVDRAALLQRQYAMRRSPNTGRDVAKPSSPASTTAHRVAARRSSSLDHAMHSMACSH